MKAMLDVQRSLHTGGMWFDLSVADNSFGYTGTDPGVLLSSTLARADALLSERYSLSAPWAWSAERNRFEREVSEKDATLDELLGGRPLREITWDNLEETLRQGAPLTKSLQSNWRIQEFWDGDSDYNIAIHNGTEWVRAYYSEDDTYWHTIGIGDGSVYPARGTACCEYLASFEPDGS